MSRYLFPLMLNTVRPLTQSVLAQTRRTSSNELHVAFSVEREFSRKSIRPCTRPRDIPYAGQTADSGEAALDAAIYAVYAEQSKYVEFAIKSEPA